MKGDKSGAAFLRAGLTGGAIVYVILAAAALAAGDMPWLALSQAPAPYLAVLGLLLAVALATCRRRALGATVLIGSAVFWTLIAPLIIAALQGAGVKVPDDGQTRLKLALVENSSQSTIDYILAQHPDIVVVADRSAPDHDRLAALAATYPAAQASSMAKGPVVLVRPGMALKVRSDATIESPFDLVQARIAFEDTDLDLIVVHLSRPFPLGDPTRSGTEIARLVEILQRVGPDHMILAGDFNRTPWMSEMAHLRKELKLAQVSAPGTWPSWSVPLLRLPIDQILVGPALQLQAIDAGADVGSDHLPLIAEILLKP